MPCSYPGQSAEDGAILFLSFVRCGFAIRRSGPLRHSGRRRRLGLAVGRPGATGQAQEERGPKSGSGGWLPLPPDPREAPPLRQPLRPGRPSLAPLRLAPFAPPPALVSRVTSTFVKASTRPARNARRLFLGNVLIACQARRPGTSAASVPAAGTSGDPRGLGSPKPPKEKAEELRNFWQHLTISTNVFITIIMISNLSPCPTCSGTRIQPHIPTSTPCPDCAHLSWTETAATVCAWHERHKTGWPVGDPKWAQGYLNKLEQDGLVTAEEAAAIRKDCNWLIQGSLSL